MAPFLFTQRGNLADYARHLTLAQYTPEITLEGLLTGVDNVRTDVYLSPKFCDVTRQHIARLLAKYGNIEDFVVEDAFSRAAPMASLMPSRTRTGFIGSPEIKDKSAATTVGTSRTGIMNMVAGAKPNEPAEFKKCFAELHIVGLNRAKAENNISIDLLLRLAAVKLIRNEIAGQFGLLLEKCKTKLKAYDGPRALNPQKGAEMRERFAQFQVGKKSVLRKAAQEIFTTSREIEKESLAKLRRSLFGDVGSPAYEMFLNRLMFTEDGRDDYVNAEHYVILGNYERDPDRFQAMLEYATTFLKSLALIPAGGADEDQALDATLSVNDNAQELFGGGAPDESTPKGKSQKALLEGWMSFLKDNGVLEHVLASYEAVPLLTQYSPPINPQQLKNAIISKVERKRVESLLEEHGKISPDALHAAVKKTEGAKAADKMKTAGRYFSDFVRYHRDLRRFEALLMAMDEVNVISNDKLRELSSINNTLYEFLLPEEQQPADATVVRHIILKADIRDSTTLTRTLYERGLNPASYFSLNFFDPVNKLLPKYNATKVFIEGDALILALFEHEGEQGYGVGRTCILAKEMLRIVHAYNEQSQKSGLPVLELGLGICYQDSAPMYLMDGAHRIMISKALNESDRLSGCSKGARKYLGGTGDNLFNVYSFQTVDDADTAGMPDEFLVRYNIGGIHINALAFAKLQKEISLKLHELELPMIWEKEPVKLYSGVVPLGQGIFHKIVVREGLIAHVDARDFSLKRWTEKKYYEVCVNEIVYEYLESEFKTETNLRAARV